MQFSGFITSATLVGYLLQQEANLTKLTVDEGENVTS